MKLYENPGAECQDIVASKGLVLVGTPISGGTEEARQWLEESAALGNPSAVYWAYTMNLDAGNDEIAHQLLALAAQLGHVFAQRDLARAEMTKADSMRTWLAAARRYWLAKWNGMSFLARDVNDPRVR